METALTFIRGGGVIYDPERDGEGGGRVTLHVTPTEVKSDVPG